MQKVRDKDPLNLKTVSIEIVHGDEGRNSLEERKKVL